MEGLVDDFQVFNRGAAMFEAEIEMERRSSFLPLLLMMCLVAAIVGLAGYVIFQVRGKTPVSAQQASVVVATALEERGPAVIHFRTGLVKPSADEKPGDPNYRLLEKAGILKLVNAAGGRVVVSLTPQGERLLTSVPGCKKEKLTDGTFSYQAPLAERRLVSVAGIEMNGVNNATVAYIWKWVPNPLGEVFDAGGALVKSFNLWDRQTLINKYEADFYRADPAKSALALVCNGREWKISAQ
jgi:hypothetical protein